MRVVMKGRFYKREAMGWRRRMAVARAKEREERELWLVVMLRRLEEVEGVEWGCDVNLGETDDECSEPGWSGRRRRRQR